MIPADVYTTFYRPIKIPIFQHVTKLLYKENFTCFIASFSFFLQFLFHFVATLFFSTRFTSMRIFEKEGRIFHKIVALAQQPLSVQQKDSRHRSPHPTIQTVAQYHFRFVRIGLFALIFSLDSLFQFQTAKLSSMSIAVSLVCISSPNKSTIISPLFYISDFGYIGLEWRTTIQSSETSPE